MTLKDKFNSIDQSRITADQKAFLDKMKNVTKDFTLENKEVNDKVEGALDKMITSFKEKMPDAIKTTKKVVAPKTAKAKKTTKVVTKTSVPKRTVMSVAKEIRKEGESWADAQKRASKIIKGDKADVSKVVKTELEKLKKFIGGRKELQGISGTDIPRDAVRHAKPRGVRTVTKSGETSNQYGTFDNKLGRRYWESRDRHADRLAPNYPKDAPLLENGGDFQAGVYEKGGRFQTPKTITEMIKDGYSIHEAFDTYEQAESVCEEKDLKSGKVVIVRDKNYYTIAQKRKDYELGGTVVTDLAGHTSGGDMGLNAGMPLDGFSNTAYTGLVGETGAMSSGEMFMNGGGVKFKPYGKTRGRYKITYIADGKKQSEIWETMEMAIDNAKRYEKIDDFSKIEVFDESGKKIMAYGGGLPSGAEQSYVNYYLGQGTAQGIYELGGVMATDLAGHTGGSLGTGDPSLLSGFSNTAYTGLVGETGAMSSGEMFMAGGTLPQGAEQHYVNYYLGEGASQAIYKDGGSIKNQYEGRTAENVWSNWTEKQRSHFLTDHKNHVYKYGNLYDSLEQKEDIITKNYSELPRNLRLAISDHIEEGQYKAGGMLNANERYVLEIKGLTGLRKEAIENYIAENNLSDNDVLNIVVGLGRKQLKGVDVSVAIAGKKNNSFSKKLIEFAKDNKAMKLEEGGEINAFTLRLVKGTAGNPDEALTEPKSVQFADGGAINADLNKKVYDLAKKKKLTISNYTPSEYDKLMGQALVESLTSANFHEEAKEVVAKLENKKWSKELYESEYFDPSFEAGAFGSEVARICEWDGEDILNAYYFLTKMQGSKVHNVISQFLVVVRPSDAKMYVVHADIKTVKVYKGSKVVTYSGKDVLNGANILKNGGNIGQKAYYVPKREVVEVELKSGKTIKPANGYWIKKDAMQVVKAEKGVYVEGLDEDIDMDDDNVIRVKEMTYEYKKPSNMELAEKHNAGAFEFMKEGGKVSKFEKLSNRVAKNYEGKPVKPEYQMEYGKVYSKEEAKEVGDKVAGKVKASQKMATGGGVERINEGDKVTYKENSYMVSKIDKKNVKGFYDVQYHLHPLKTNVEAVVVDNSKFIKKMTTGGKVKKGNGEAMLLAKKIRKDGEKWTDAVKRAWLEIKK